MLIFTKTTHLLVAISLILILSSHQGETKEINVISEYVMKSNENLNESQEKAYKEALRTASEKIAVYVCSDSEIKNLQLTKDEIELLSVSLIKVHKKTFSISTISKDMVEIKINLICEFDDNVSKKLINERVKQLIERNKYNKAKQIFNEKEYIKESIRKEYNEIIRHTTLEPLLKAEYLHNKGLYKKAQEKYDYVVKDNPFYAKAFLKRGENYLSMGKINLALDDFEYAIKLDPKEAESYYNKALILDQYKNKKVEAILYYRKFLSISNSVEHSDKITLTLDRLILLEA